MYLSQNRQIVAHIEGSAEKVFMRSAILFARAEIEQEEKAAGGDLLPWQIEKVRKAFDASEDKNIRVLARVFKDELGVRWAWLLHRAGEVKYGNLQQEGLFTTKWIDEKIIRSPAGGVSFCFEKEVNGN
jgi:hypothetical protein